MKNKRSPGLVAIVIYKGFVALLLTATSIILLLALNNHQSLVEFSESYSRFQIDGVHLNVSISDR